MKGLGRLEAPDEQDARFPLGAVLPEEPTRASRYWFDGGAWLDQGDTSTCVGHSWAHWLEDGPVTHRGTIDALQLYDHATRLDEWPDNEGDRSFGTSVRAGAKALRRRGFVSEFRWAQSIDDVVLAVMERGPVVVGTDWWRGMFEPDAEGFVRLTGGLAGGHAYVLNGVGLARGVFRVKNSWGRGWGRNGRALITIEDFDELLSRGGEACLAIEKRGA